MIEEEIGLLSIVVPVYNEQENLTDIYASLLQVMQQHYGKPVGVNQSRRR